MFPTGEQDYSSVEARALLSAANWSAQPGVQKPGFFIRLVHAKPHMIKRAVAAGSTSTGPEPHEVAVALHGVRNFNGRPRALDVQLDPLLPAGAVLPTVLLSPPVGLEDGDWARLVTEWTPDAQVFATY